MIRIITLFVGFLFWNTSHAEVIKGQYVLTDYPDAQGNCLQVADELGAKFTAAYGVSVLSSDCIEQTAAGYTIAINFAEVLELNLVSTGRDVFNIDGRGQYKSLAACEASKAQEETLFTSATGLMPFVSYCFAGLYQSDLRWGLRIDAIGDASVVPFNQHAYIHGTPLSGNAAFLADFKTAIQRFSVQERQLFFGNNIELGTLSFYYYSNQAIDMSSRDIAFFDSTEQCQNSLAAVQGIEQLNAGNNSFWFCTKGLFSRKFRLHRMNLSADTLKVMETIERHPNQAKCLEMVASTIDQYRTRYNITVLGAICGRPDDNDIFSTAWKVFLITE